jgi:hypothetical protein
MVTLELYNGKGWAPSGDAMTSATGQATWTLKLTKGTHRLRARWAGAGDLAGSASSLLVLKVG